MMSGNTEILDDKALDVLFREARTFSGWTDRAVSDVILEALYDLFKWGPTSANCSPARIVFVKTPEGRERLKPCLIEGNIEQTMAAPATAIIAHDMKFYEHLPRLFPHTDAKSWFTGNQSLIEETALRNGSLQGAYLILAARALGLDCGPMSGFDQMAAKDEFFPDEDVQVNFLCNIGYGNPESLHPRGPRFNFDEVCKII